MVEINTVLFLLPCFSIFELFAVLSIFVFYSRLLKPDRPVQPGTGHQSSLEEHENRPVKKSVKKPLNREKPVWIKNQKKWQDEFFAPLKPAADLNLNKRRHRSWLPSIDEEERNISTIKEEISTTIIEKEKKKNKKKKIGRKGASSKRDNIGVVK